MDKETQKDETEDLATQDVKAQETEVVEVAIVESDAAPEEMPVADIEAARVVELVAASDLDESAHLWVARQIYQTEEAVTQAIEEMKVFIADMTPAGLPFAMGETAAATTAGVPKLLTAEELEERARNRTRGILMEIDSTYAGNL